MRMLFRRREFWLCAALSAGVGLTGCGDAETEMPLNQRTQDVTSDLRVGSRGPEVQALHEYLTKYGYFPNPTLAKTYPAWRPQVATPPDDPSVFDAHTEEAVARLQASRRLPATGVVDGATRTVLRSARCGVPDGIEEVDDDAKFLLTAGWRDGKATWSFDSRGAPAGTTAVIIEAIATWAAQTNLSLTQTTATNANIRIRFAPIDGASTTGRNTLGVTASPLDTDGGSMTIDSEDSWSVNGSPGTFDLKAVITHELGHALGIKHSGFDQAMMWPDYTGFQTLWIDDKVVISQLYDKYGTFGTKKATDIAANWKGALWITSREPLGDGFRIYKWGGTDWIPTDGGAVRIALTPSGIPWVVTKNGTIYRRRTADPTLAEQWELIGGQTASDIGIGGGAQPAGPTSDGHVWIIGRNTLGDGGFQIYKYAGGSSWTAVDGAATKITVGRDGIPWVVTKPGVLYRRTTSSPTSGGWETLPGTATDLGLAMGNYLWGIAPVSSGEENVAVWNEQPGVNTPAGDVTTARRSWMQGKRMGAGGSSCAVTVGLNGRPFVVDNNGTIYTSLDGAP